LDEQLLDEAMVVFTKKDEELASSPLGEKVDAVSEQLNSLDALFLDKYKESPPTEHTIEPYQGTSYQLEQPSKGPRMSYVSILIGAVVVFLVLVMINS